MKSLIIALAAATTMLAPGVATADDADDVIAAVMDYISGWNDGDAAKVAAHMLPGATAFTQGAALAAAYVAGADLTCQGEGVGVAARSSLPRAPVSPPTQTIAERPVAPWFSPPLSW